MIHGLSRKTRSAAARENGDAMSCGRRHYRNDIIGRLGNDDRYWLNLVDARVGAVQQPRHPVGPNFTGYVPSQLFDEVPAVPLNVFGKHGHVGESSVGRRSVSPEQ